MFKRAFVLTATVVAIIGAAGALPAEAGKAKGAFSASYPGADLGLAPDQRRVLNENFGKPEPSVPYDGEISRFVEQSWLASVITQPAPQKFAEMKRRKAVFKRR